MYVVWLFCHVCVHDTFFYFFFFFKLKTAYEMRISDWSSDVCSSDLSCRPDEIHLRQPMLAHFRRVVGVTEEVEDQLELVWRLRQDMPHSQHILDLHDDKLRKDALQMVGNEFIELLRSEEHTSELQSLMRISYAVFCLKQKTSSHTAPKY